MTGPAQPHRRRRKSRSRGEDGAVAATPQAPGARAGTPRYLASQADIASPAEREARSLGGAHEAPTPTPLGRLGALAAAGAPSPGVPLDANARARGEQRLGALPQVRVHRDSPLAARFGANALTWNGNIHFAPGAYAPGTPSGDRLIGHELTHVAQQRGGADVAQFDLGMSLPVSLGAFDINMVSQTVGAQTGMAGTISFTPLDTAPYTTRLGLTQAIAMSEMTSSTMDPRDQSGAPRTQNIGSTNQADVTALLTDNADATATGARPGWRIDAETNTRAAGDERDTFYQDSWATAGSTQYGHVRGPGDVAPTVLWDFPNWSVDSDFDFETAAVSEEDGTVYGALSWGFEVQGGAVQNEYVEAADGASPTYDAALEKFRAHYQHEPMAVYFGTGDAALTGAEQAKIDTAAAWVAANPTTTLRLEGFTDTRGGLAANRNVAADRAAAVSAALVAAGVPAASISTTAWPEPRTDEFGANPADGGTAAQAAQPGNLQANRRVVIHFSTP